MRQNLKHFQIFWLFIFLRLSSRVLADDLLLDYFDFDMEDESNTESTSLAVNRETKVVTRNVNQKYKFTVSNKVEYYIKFEVPESVAKKFEKDPGKHIFQVNAASVDAKERHPVDITVKQLKRINSFQIPHVQRESDKLIYSSPENSIDFCPLSTIDKNATVLMTIATSSRKNVEVAVKVLIKGKQADWHWIEDSSVYETNTTITPTITRARYFDTSLMKTKYLRVKVNQRSNSNCLCSLISIQEPRCPFYDSIGAAQRYGKWATMLNFTTIIVDKREFPNGFIIVLVASATDDLCHIVDDKNRCYNYNTNVTNPKKRIRIQIEENGSEATYAGACMTIISAYGVIALVTVTISIIEFKYNYEDFIKIKAKMSELEAQLGETWNKFGEKMVRKMSDQLNSPSKFKEVSALQEGIASTVHPTLGPVQDGLVTTLPPTIGPASNRKDLTTEVDDSVGGDNTDHNKQAAEVDADADADADASPNQPTPGVNSRGDQDTEKGIDHDGFVEDYHEADYAQIATEAELKGTVFATEDEVDERIRTRLKTDLRVPDLCQKLDNPGRSKSIYQKSELYLGISLLISLYYSLPVLQMVFAFSANQKLTGNQDICYYNDLCRKPVSQNLLRDFNHVFSNLGYMVFGALFMFLVFLKKWKHKSFLQDNRIKEREYGVPQQYGLYFSMGLALFMEGVMSGSYHICPTNITFQFDTTFMYLISILMFLKLYQMRHADVSANAVGVFFGLGVSLVLETISIIYSGPWFWVFFCLAYIIVIMVTVVHAYNLGVVRYDYKILYNVTRILWFELKKIVSVPGHPAIPRVRSRLVCLSCMAGVNLSLCLFFGIARTSGASNYLLAIYILNLAMYFMYYCIMKVKHGEKIMKVPILYSTLSLLCVIPALSKRRQKFPHQNQGC